MQRRTFITSLIATWLAAQLPLRASAGQQLAQAARNQIGVTLNYDPRYVRIPYPNGDVPRSTGVCADVILRAARDAFHLDLQKLVHEDMLRDFAAYPARRAWGSCEPDSNIDHRRVLNLETYWQRAHAELWRAPNPTPGDQFPQPLAIGDIVTFRLDSRLPHVAIVSAISPQPKVVHNIGNGAEETELAAFHPHQAIAPYRWPKIT